MYALPTAFARDIPHSIVTAVYVPWTSTSCAVWSWPYRVTFCLPRMIISCSKYCPGRIHSISRSISTRDVCTLNLLFCGVLQHRGYRTFGAQQKIREQSRGVSVEHAAKACRMAAPGCLRHGSCNETHQKGMPISGVSFLRRLGKVYPIAYSARCQQLEPPSIPLSSIRANLWCPPQPSLHGSTSDIRCSVSPASLESTRIKSIYFV